MIEILYAILIGIVQGLTEFLPISSTAHMTIVAKFLGTSALSDPKLWTATMATIQLGTLGSLLVFFRREIVSISGDLLSSIFHPNLRKAQNFHLGLMIILGSFPIFILGYLLKDFIEGSFTKNLWAISVSLIALALVLFISERVGKFRKSVNEITLADALIIGFAQALALIPGVSRSGATISAGLFLNMKRDEAARFSFLLSIPAVFVSGLYEFATNFKLIVSQNLLFLIISLIFAFIFGLLAISFLLNFLKTKSTLVFVVYRIVLGLLIILWLV
jgi:undecaprenyl-diphosphatase